MAYNKDIPQATDNISVSQSQILNNFQEIFSLVSVNHVIFDSGLPTGKHSVVQFNPQSAQPTVAPALPNPPVFPAILQPGEVALYNFLNPRTLKNDLYATKVLPSGMGGTIIDGFPVPMTDARAPAATQILGIAGYTYLPSSILIKWGSVNVPAGASTFSITPGPATFPDFVAVYHVMATPQTVAASLAIRIATSNSFDVVNGSSGSMVISWLAIGR